MPHPVRRSASVAPVSGPATAASGPTIRFAAPLSALAALRDAGYDVTVYETAPSGPAPEGQPGSDYFDAKLSCDPPAGDCVIGVYTSDFEALDPKNPTHSLAMEVADRDTARKLGHGC